MSGDFNFFVPITKATKNPDGSCTVSGYCTTPALDLDGEIISLDAVRKAAPGYWEWRNIRRMHSSDAVGVGKELNIDSKGAFLSAKIVNSDAVKGCLEGVYKGFSIGGKKLEKVGNTITAIDWIETSIVDRPANPECKFDVAKKANGEGYLLKAASPRDPLAKALSRMSKAALTLAKSDDEPDPEPDSGPLEPAPEKRPKEVAAKDAGGGDDAEACAKHGIVGCEKCAAKAAKKAKKADTAQKRDFSAEQRRSAAAEGDALPDGSFPIKNKEDLDNARRLVGHSKNKPAARALISRRARELGVKIPDGASKKAAKAIIKTAITKTAIQSQARSRFSIGDSDFDDFLSLRGSRAPSLKSLGSRPILTSFNSKEFDMPKDITGTELSGLDGAVLEIIKRAAQPTRAQRMNFAQTNMRKANKARKAAREEISNVHKMLRKNYLAKEAFAKAGKKPTDNDADDMECFAKAMSGIQKAFGEINKVGTFMKAAREQMEKLGRSGQKEQEPSHGEPGYEVPRGVTDLTPDSMSGADPGRPGRSGGVAPAYPGSEGVDPSSTYAGKLAGLAKNGQLTPEVVSVLVENAKLEAQMGVVTRVPQAGRRPYNMDMTKLAGEPRNGRNEDPLFKAMKDAEVNPAHLMIEVGEDGVEDPRRRMAVAKTVGQYLHPDSGNGKSAIFDPNFKGRAAA